MGTETSSLVYESSDSVGSFKIKLKGFSAAYPYPASWADVPTATGDLVVNVGGVVGSTIFDVDVALTFTRCTAINSTQELTLSGQGSLRT